MKEKLKEFFTISNENILLLVLAAFCFSAGIAGSYRQLWLEANRFDVSQISKIFSVALICSAVIAFIISLFSAKIKVKDVLLLSLALRIFAMTILLLKPEVFLIKTCVLLTIMCETIFSISYYPLLTEVSKSDHTYRKKSLVDYISKDVSVISCGLLIGVSIGKTVFDYDSCLILSLLSCMLSGFFLLLYKPKRKYAHKEESTLKDQAKSIFKSKLNIWYLIMITFVYISYGIIFDLMMILLTGYIKFSVSFASIFIIVSNLLGSISCSFLNKYGTKLSISMSSIIKYGLRALAYLVAAITNNIMVFIISIVIAYITSRILEDKVTGVFINKVKVSDQFLYGNMRYFAACVGEGIGAYLAGVFLDISLSSLFFGAFIFTLIQTLIIIYMDKIMHKSKK